MSVKLSMIALFMELDFDALIVLRTARSNMWANPVERMSLVNTGLQGVGLMRRQMSDAFEKAVGEKRDSVILTVCYVYFCMGDCDVYACV